MMMGNVYVFCSLGTAVSDQVITVLCSLDSWQTQADGENCKINFIETYQNDYPYYIEI
jgi:hypothetical protein